MLQAAYKIRAAPKTANSAARSVPCAAGEKAAIAPPDAGGAAPLAVGDEVPEAEPLADPLAEPDDADAAARDDELAEDPDDVVLLLAELDVAEGAPLAEDDRVTPAPPVGIKLSVVLAGRTSELEGEGSLT